MHTHAEIKRLVIGDRKTSKYGNVRLHVAEHDGELYATNSYWLTPAKAVAPLLAHNNLPIDKPGVYDVNSNLSAQEIEPPNVGPLMPKHTHADDIQRSRVAGTGAVLFIQPGNRLLALFDRTDTIDGLSTATHVAFDAAYLEFIEDGTRDPIYRQAGPGRPLGVYDADATFLGLLMPVRI